MIYSVKSARPRAFLARRRASPPSSMATSSSGSPGSRLSLGVDPMQQSSNRLVTILVDDMRHSLVNLMELGTWRSSAIPPECLAGVALRPPTPSEFPFIQTSDVRDAYRQIPLPPHLLPSNPADALSRVGTLHGLLCRSNLEDLLSRSPVLGGPGPEPTDAELHACVPLHPLSVGVECGMRISASERRVCWNYLTGLLQLPPDLASDVLEVEMSLNYLRGDEAGGSGGGRSDHAGPPSAE